MKAVQEINILVKQAALGDIVNAGVSTMAMGSPFAPKMFTPGTNTVKPTAQIQQENKNSAIGGIAGLLASNPYTWRVLRFVTPRPVALASGLVKAPLATLKNPKTWWDVAHLSEIGWKGRKKWPQIASVFSPIIQTGKAFSDARHELALSSADDKHVDQRIDSAKRMAGQTIGNAEQIAGRMIDRSEQRTNAYLDSQANKIDAAIANSGRETLRDAVGRQFGRAKGTVNSTLEQSRSAIDRRVDYYSDLAQDLVAAHSISGGDEMLKEFLKKRISRAGKVNKNFSDTLGDWNRYALEIADITPGMPSIIANYLNNAYRNSKKMPMALGVPLASVQAAPFGTLISDLIMGNGSKAKTKSQKKVNPISDALLARRILNSGKLLLRDNQKTNEGNEVNEPVMGGGVNHGQGILE